MRIIIPMITLKMFGVMFGLYWVEINKVRENLILMYFNVFLTLPPFYTSTYRQEIIKAFGIVKF